MKKKLLIIIIGICLIATMVLPALVTGCGGDKTTTTKTTAVTTTTQATTTVPKPDDYDTRESIVIGAARPLSGALASIGDYALGPILPMWVDEVNAEGGLYIAEYDRRIPIELLIYDDTSDLGTMTTLLEKLILEDEVDFIMPPCSTAFLYAAAPLANNYEYIFLGAEGGCTTLTDMLPELPYVFANLNYSDWYQVPVLADLFAEWGVETVAMIYIADLHGIEYSHTAHSEFLLRGIDVVMSKSVLAEATDLTPLLKEAEDSGADAFCAFTYPPVSIYVYGQAIELGYNPKAFVVGPGANFQFYYDAFGPMTEGLIGFGAYNSKSSPAIADWIDRFVDLYGLELMDWWGGAFYYAILEFFGQAIEEAGTLDQAVIRDVMASSTFETILGDTWYEMFGDGGGLLAKECHPGEVGQWQDGVFEVIGPTDKATADPIYPKPEFPAG